MRCASCGFHQLCDTWQISFDWNLDIELEEGADLPALCEPLAPGMGVYDKAPTAAPATPQKPPTPPTPQTPQKPPARPAPIAPPSPPVRLARTSIVRCPECGSTDAGRDEVRSALERSYMRCLVCSFGEDCDASKVSADWHAEIGLPAGADVPAFVEPLRARRAVEPRPVTPPPARVRWKVMGEDTFARETYFIGLYETEAAAKAAVAEREARHQLTQDEAVRDTLWIVKVEDA